MRRSADEISRPMMDERRYQPVRPPHAHGAFMPESRKLFFARGQRVGAKMQS